MPCETCREMQRAVTQMGREVRNVQKNVGVLRIRAETAEAALREIRDLPDNRSDECSEIARTALAQSIGEATGPAK